MIDICGTLSFNRPCPYQWSDLAGQHIPTQLRRGQSKIMHKAGASVHGIYESIISNDDRTRRIVLPFAGDHDRVGRIAGHRTLKHLIPFNQDRATIRDIDQDARRAQGAVCDLAVDNFSNGGTRFNVVAFVLPEEFRAFHSQRCAVASVDTVRAIWTALAIANEHAVDYSDRKFWVVRHKNTVFIIHELSAVDEQRGALNADASAVSIH